MNFHWCIKGITHHGTWAACPLVPPHALPPFQWSPPGEPHPHWRCLYPWPEQELWACRQRNEVRGGQEHKGDMNQFKQSHTFCYCYSGSNFTSIIQVTFIISAVTFIISDGCSSNSSHVSIPGLYSGNTFTICIIIVALHQYVHLPTDTPVSHCYSLNQSNQSINSPLSLCLCLSPLCLTVCLNFSHLSFLLSFLSLFYTLSASTSYNLLFCIICIAFIYLL